VASLHVVRPFANDSSLDLEVFANQLYNGNIMMCGGYDMASATKVVAEGRASVVPFGKPYISNLDLAERSKTGGPVAEWDEATFYTPGPEGYIDYPRYKAK
jgi:N-ethylmaleimide reductase